MQEEQKNVINQTDIILAVCIVLEAIALYFMMTAKITFLGTLLPIVVSIFSVTITFLACRDFFRQHK
ncbi:hypothetical protein LJC23_07460 [Desulfovibrio sp. OttesenSCG-928-I05]|nr:hypothetical protein [Desulfovibrio sp. OttesenSCG-928-I05]